MTHISQAGLDLLKEREGLRLTAYQCPAGVWTIGYGHTGDVVPGATITEAEANILLRRDLMRAEACVDRTCPETTQPQFDAMVCLAFNIGTGAFAKSSVARLHNKGEYAQAGQAFAMWNKAAGKVVSGLVSRRAAETALYLTDCPREPENVPSRAEGAQPAVKSNTIQGITTASVGTGIAAATEVARQLRDVQDSLETGGAFIKFLLSYGPMIAVVFVLLGLAGIGYGYWKRKRAGV